MKVHIVACSPHYELHKNVGKYNILSSQLGGMSIEPNYTKYSRHVDYGNTESLAKRYNTFIEHYATTRTPGYDYTDDDILVLAHDDIVINERWTLFDKLKAGLEKYDIVGLAGGSNPVISPPCLWHLMCDKSTWSGNVGHVAPGSNDIYGTHFGPYGRVLILDGLFLAFKPKKIYDLGIKFDESCPAKFHFYDIDFSLTCNKNRLKLGTVNIDVTHSSPGLKAYTPEWLAGQEWFINKFKSGKY